MPPNPIPPQSSAISQYSTFRSSPSEFPSYDRLRFVRLDEALLPRAWRHDEKTDSKTGKAKKRPDENDDRRGSERLTHWPSILYSSIPELIRDLPASTDKAVKASLILEHARTRQRVVGRLIGWRGAERGSKERRGGGEAGAKNGEGAARYFPDGSVDLIRLPGSSLSDAEAHRNADGRVLSFFEGQFALEEACARLLRGAEDGEVREYAERWKRAADMAVNILAADVGEVALPLDASDRNGGAAEKGAVRKEKKRKALADVTNRRKEATRKKKKSVPPAAPADEPPTPAISPDDPFSTAWKSLRSAGWTWRSGSGLVMDYYYVKPGRKIKGGIEGEDYFVGEEGVKAFLREEYRWVGPLEEEDAHDQKCSGGDVVRRHSEEIPSRNELDEQVPPLKTPLDPRATWRSAWDTLLQSGWSWREGSGLMMDYYYVKPGKKIKGGTVGVDYFVERESLEEYMRRWYGWIGREEVEEECVVKPKARKISLDVDDANAEVKKLKSAKLKSSEVERKSLDFDDDESQKNKKPKAAKVKVHVKSRKSNGTPAQSKKDSPSTNENKTPEPSSFAADWSELWPRLKSEGWTVVKAGKYNRLHDWYWVRPWCDPGSALAKVGEDYFLSEEDVMSFIVSSGSSSQVATGGGKEDVAASAKEEPVAMEAEADPAEALKPAYSPSEFKDNVWPTLKEEGWNVIKAGKFNKLHDWYYVRPGCDPGNSETELGKDYFLTEEEVFNFVKHSIGSNVVTSSAAPTAEDKVPSKPAESSPNIPSAPVHSKHAPKTPLNCQTQPQDPAIPLPPSPQSSTDSAEDPYHWDNLWETLKKAGWRVISAGKYNRLHDWYYVRPNRDPGDGKSRLGRHYFTCPDEVIEFVKAYDEENEFKGGNGRKSMDAMLSAFEQEAEA